MRPRVAQDAYSVADAIGTPTLDPHRSALQSGSYEEDDSENVTRQDQHRGRGRVGLANTVLGTLLAAFVAGHTSQRGYRVVQLTAVTEDERRAEHQSVLDRIHNGVCPS